MTNLILDPIWPLRRRDGSVRETHLWNLTEDLAQNPVTGLELPRQDFRACGTQFLVALLQTVYPPETPRNWRQLLKEPPEPTDLKTILEPWADAFTLDGDGPRFMQDLELAPEEGEPKDVSALLIDAPGGNTLKNNADHFVKRNQTEALDPFMTAIALYTLQSSAPSGGVGHRTSIRGGGPLSTLVLDPEDRSLWRTLWLNVLERKSLEAELETTPEGVFPWLSPTVISKGNRAIHRDGSHYLQVYWAMPRRIRLAEPVEGTCSLTGRKGPVYTNIITKNYGNNYDYTGWTHPLSPHYQNKADLLPVLGSRTLLTYPNWLGLTFGTSEKNRKRFAARVVTEFVGNRGRFLRKKHARLWINGYDMDNMKAREPIDQVLPLIVVEEDRDTFRSRIECLTECARNVASSLTQQYKLAASRSKPKGNVDFVADRYWENTQADFFQNVSAMSENPSAEVSRKLLEGWLRRLQREALGQFDQLTRDFPTTVTDQKKIVEARRALAKFTSPTGPKLRKLAGLPAIQKKENP